MPGTVDTQEFDINEFHGCARPHGDDGQVSRNENWRAYSQRIAQMKTRNGSNAIKDALSAFLNHTLGCIGCVTCRIRGADCGRHNPPRLGTTPSRRNDRFLFFLAAQEGDTLMPVLDNPKWELAAQEVAKGRTQVAAIEAAGYAPHDSNAARLIGNDRVKLRIRELQEQAAMSISITLEGQIAKLEDLLNQAKALQANRSRCLRNRQTERANGFQDATRREQARGRVCEHERRRAKAICVWK